MDKQSLSRWGGIICVVLILAIIIAFATPFGSYVVTSVKGVFSNFSFTGGNAMDNNYDDIVDFPYPGSGSGGLGSGGSGSEETIAAGLYETGSNYTVLLASWDALLADGTVHVDNGVVYTNLDPDTYENSSVVTLAGDLMLPDDGSITALGDAVYDEESDSTTGNFAFTMCSNLTDIVIPDSVTTIGLSAFESCTSLTSIDIPDSVTSIGAFAFFGCENLESVTIPASVTSIEGGAFDTCTALETVTFSENSQLVTINESAFAYCTGLASITIPDGVTNIGGHTFHGCESLEIVEIPNSVMSIGEYAFSCTNLSTFIIPNNLTIIDIGTFSTCKSLTSITIPDKVINVNYGAFAFCTSLTVIDFEGSVAQWNAITFDPTWNDDVPATTVTCSDGTVTLS